jgi:hypothetical protein
MEELSKTGVATYDRLLEGTHRMIAGGLDPLHDGIISDIAAFSQLPLIGGDLTRVISALVEGAAGGTTYMERRFRAMGVELRTITETVADETGQTVRLFDERTGQITKNTGAAIAIIEKYIHDQADTIRESYDNSWQYATNVVRAHLQFMMRDAGEGLYQETKRALQDFGRFMNQHSDELKAIAKAISDTMGGMAHAVISQLRLLGALEVREALGGMLAGLGHIKDQIVTIIRDILEALFPQEATTRAAGLAAFIFGIQNNFEEFSGWLEEHRVTIENGILGMIHTFGLLVSGGLNFMRELAAVFFDPQVQNAFGHFVEMLGALKDSVLTILTGLFSQQGQLPGNAAGGVADFLDTLSHAIANAAIYLQDNAPRIIAFIQTIGATIINDLGGVIAFLTQQGPGLATAVASIFGPIVDYVLGHPELAGHLVALIAALGALGALAGSLTGVGAAVAGLLAPIGGFLGALNGVADFILALTLRHIPAFISIMGSIKDVFLPFTTLGDFFSSLGGLFRVFLGIIESGGGVLGLFAAALRGIGTAIEFVVAHIGTVVGLMGRLSGSFGGVISTVTGFARLLVGPLGPAVIVTFFQGIATAIGAAATAAQLAIGTIVAAIGGPITLAIIAGIALGALFSAAWINNWGDIQGKTHAAVDAIGGFFSELGTHTKEIIDGVGRFFDQLGTHTREVADGVGRAFDTLGTNARGIADTIGSTVGNFFSGLGDIGNKIREYLTPGYEIIKSIVGEVSGAFLEIVTLPGALIGRGIAKLVELLGPQVELFATSMGESFSKAGEVVHKMLDELGGFIGDRFDELGSMAREKWDTITGIIGGAFDWIGTHAREQWDIFTKGAGDAFSATGEVIHKELNEFGGFIGDRFSEIGTKAREIWDGITGIIGGFFDWLGTHTHEQLDILVKGFGDAFSGAGKVAHEQLDALLSWVKDWVGALLGFFGDRTDDLLNAVIGWLPGVWSSFREWLHKLHGSGFIDEWIEDLIKFLPDKFTELWDAVVNTIQQWLAEWQAKLDALKNLIVNAVNALPDVLKDSWDALYTTFSDNLQKILDYVGTWKDSLIDGIKTGFGGAVTAALEQFGKLPDSIKDILLNIFGHSIVENWLKDLHGGMSDGMARVADAGGSSFNKLTDHVDSTMSRTKDRAQTGMRDTERGVVEGQPSGNLAGYNTGSARDRGAIAGAPPSSTPGYVSGHGERGGRRATDRNTGDYPGGTATTTTGGATTIGSTTTTTPRRRASDNASAIPQIGGGGAQDTLGLAPGTRIPHWDENLTPEARAAFGYFSGQDERIAAQNRASRPITVGTAGAFSIQGGLPAAGPLPDYAAEAANYRATTIPGTPFTPAQRETLRGGPLSAGADYQPTVIPEQHAAGSYGEPTFQDWRNSLSQEQLERLDHQRPTMSEIRSAGLATSTLTPNLPGGEDPLAPLLRRRAGLRDTPLLTTHPLNDAGGRTLLGPEPNLPTVAVQDRNRFFNAQVSADFPWQPGMPAPPVSAEGVSIIPDVDEYRRTMTLGGAMQHGLPYGGDNVIQEVQGRRVVNDILSPDVQWPSADEVHRDPNSPAQFYINQIGAAVAGNGAASPDSMRFLDTARLDPSQIEFRTPPSNAMQAAIEPWTNQILPGIAGRLQNATGIGQVRIGTEPTAERMAEINRETDSDNARLATTGDQYGGGLSGLGGPRRIAGAGAHVERLFEGLGVDRPLEQGEFRGSVSGGRPPPAPEPSRVSSGPRAVDTRDAPEPAIPTSGGYMSSREYANSPWFHPENWRRGEYAGPPTNPWVGGGAGVARPGGASGAAAGGGAIGFGGGSGSQPAKKANDPWAGLQLGGYVRQPYGEGFTDMPTEFTGPGGTFGVVQEPGGGYGVEQRGVAGAVSPVLDRITGMSNPPMRSSLDALGGSTQPSVADTLGPTGENLVRRMDNAGIFLTSEQGSGQSTLSERGTEGQAASDLEAMNTQIGASAMFTQRTGRRQPAKEATTAENVTNQNQTLNFTNTVVNEAGVDFVTRMVGYERRLFRNGGRG